MEVPPTTKHLMMLESSGPNLIKVGELMGPVEGRRQEVYTRALGGLEEQRDEMILFSIFDIRFSNFRLSLSLS